MRVMRIKAVEPRLEAMAIEVGDERRCWFSRVMMEGSVG
jgi:hypothetical protein